MCIRDRVECIGIYNSIKDGSTRPADWFDAVADTGKTDAVNEKLKGEQSHADSV